MTLAELLAADLLAWLDRAGDGVPRRVLLWLDPESQFARLAPRLEAPLAEAGARLLVLAGRDQQLLLKLELLRLEAGPGAPGLTPHSPALSSIRAASMATAGGEREI